MALLGLGESLQRALVGDRVADRVLEPVGAEAGDEQEVGDAGLGGLLVGLAVGGVAEDDHRDVRAPAHQLLGEHEAVAPRRLDLAVDEHHVVVVRACSSACSSVVTCSISAVLSSARTGAWRASSALTARTFSGLGSGCAAIAVATPPPARSAARRSPASRR